MRRNAWSLIGLGALALVTAVLVILSFLHVRPQTPESVTAVPRPGGSPLSAPAAREPRASTAANIKEVLDRPAPTKIVVLGDATGMDDATAGVTRWVTRWAEKLGERRPVTVAARGSDGGYAEPVRFGSGDGAAIEILNASDRPGRIALATEQADSLIPDDVDLVIISFGHSEDVNSLPGELDALWAELPVGAMAMVMTQNPQRGAGAAAQRARAQAIGAWAQENKVFSVDVFNAFIAAPEPLVQLLGRDSVNPNDRGSEVWRDAVVEALR